jgi:hypothetical protein
VAKLVVVRPGHGGQAGCGGRGRRRRVPPAVAVSAETEDLPGLELEEWQGRRHGGIGCEVREV